MAFADEMLTVSEADMMIVDRRHQPGGHWNDAYPFVRLHGPSATYGVNSRPLGSGRIDATGVNKGHYELVSGAEICGYFDQVMRQRFLPSGRVNYLALSTYADDGTATSLISGRCLRVKARKKIVDATYLDTKLPSTHPPGYIVTPEATCISPNALPRVTGPRAGYVIVGAGKTAMDVCGWLLEQGIESDAIQWIRPRDAWILDRVIVQPGLEFFNGTVGAFADQMQIAAHARSLEDLIDRLEAAGQIMRIDPLVRPTMYRGAILSRSELVRLQRVKNVVRLGRVASIGQNEITLQHGVIPTSTDHVHIDCSAAGFAQRPPKPVFERDRITLQTVRTCQTNFSGAIIAKIEAALDNDAEKNQVSAVVPLPNDDIDWARMLLINARNQYRWRKNAELSAWLTGARLDGLASLVAQVQSTDVEKKAILERYRDNIAPALANLHRLLGSVAS